MNSTIFSISDPLVQALGWTLIHFLWQGTLLAALFVGVRLVLWRGSIRQHYLTGCLSLALMAGSPLLTFYRVYPHASATRPAPVPTRLAAIPRWTDVGHPTMVVTAPPAFNQTSSAPRLQRSASGLVRWLPWMVGGWLGGVGFMSLRLLGGWLKVRQLRRCSTTPLEAVWLAKLEVFRQRLAVSRPVVTFQCLVVQVPTVIGWFRPVILVPAALLTGLPAGQIEALLAHELAHIRRWDGLINLLQNVLETLLFYHPAVWWVSRCVRADREQCCDELAAEMSGDRLEYACALAALEELRGVDTAWGLGAKDGPLLRRIRRLLGKPCPNPQPTGWGLAGLVVVALSLVVGLGKWETAAVGGVERASATNSAVGGAGTLWAEPTNASTWQLRTVDPGGKWEYDVRTRTATLRGRASLRMGLGAGSLAPGFPPVPSQTGTNRYLQVSSDQVTVEQSAGTSTFRGQVSVEDYLGGEVQGTLRCDHLSLNMSAASGRLERLLAEGHVICTRHRAGTATDLPTGSALKCERLVIRATNAEPVRLSAEGNVMLEVADYVARCGRLDYDTAAEQARFTVDPTVTGPHGSAQAPVVVLDRKEGRLVIPDASLSGSSSPATAVVDLVKELPGVYLAGRAVTADQLREELARRVAEQPDLHLLIRVNTEVRNGDLMKVLDIANAAKVRGVSLHMERDQPRSEALPAPSKEPVSHGPEPKDVAQVTGPTAKMAKVMAIRGAATYQETPDGPWKPLAKGMSLSETAAIKTALNSQVDLILNGYRPPALGMEHPRPFASSNTPDPRDIGLLPYHEVDAHSGILGNGSVVRITADTTVRLATFFLTFFPNDNPKLNEPEPIKAGSDARPASRAAEQEVLERGRRPDREDLQRRPGLTPSDTPDRKNGGKVSSGNREDSFRGTDAADYFHAILSIYDNGWAAPTDLTNESQVVVTRIVIARSGEVVSAGIIRPSGDRSLNASVRKVLDEIKAVPPFPEGTREPERIYSIRFKVKPRAAWTSSSEAGSNARSSQIGQLPARQGDLAPLVELLGELPSHVLRLQVKPAKDVRQSDHLPAMILDGHPVETAEDLRDQLATLVTVNPKAALCIQFEPRNMSLREVSPVIQIANLAGISRLSMRHDSESATDASDAASPATTWIPIFQIRLVAKETSVAEVRTKLSELEAELAELRLQYTDRRPEVLKVLGAIAEYRQSLLAGYDEMADPENPSANLLVCRRVLLDERSVESAELARSWLANEANIRLRFTSEGASAFSDITGTNVARRLAIVFEGRLLCAPRIQERIESANMLISGKFTAAEARAIAEKLNSARLVREGLILVTGEVAHPMSLHLETGRKLTILDAIEQTGGLRPGASPDKVELSRQGRTRVFRLKYLKGTAAHPAAIVYLEPGDQITARRF